MPFTSEEILSSVESIVLSSIRRPYDTLGVRRTDVTFTDVQEAAAGVFLLYRNAPFYVLLLAAKRVSELVVSEGNLVQQLLDAVQATGRDVFPIEDLTPLANARAALLELEGAVGQRKQSFKSIEKVPAFVRYESNLSSFLSSAGGNVKSGGQIVQTPQEARTIIPGLVTQLKDSHTALLKNVKLVQNGITDFGSLNLPALVAAGVISRARQVLTDRLSELEALTPTERLEVIRSVVLDLLSQKGVVKEFGSFTGPSSVFDISGTGQAFSDSTHLATPAKSVAGTGGPYPLTLASTVLDFFLDAPFVAKLTTFPLDSITQGTNVFEANFNKAAGFGITVLVGDVIYVQSGPNTGTRWVVKTVNPTFLVAVGESNPVTPSVGSTIDLWPAPSASVPLATSLIAKIEGFLPEPFVTDGSTGLGVATTFIFKIDAVTVTASITSGPAVSAATVVGNINTAISAQAPGKPVAAETYFSPLKYDSSISISFVAGTTYRFTVLAGSLDNLGIFVGDKVKITSGPDLGTVLTISAIGPGPIQFVDASSGGAIASSGTRQTIQIGSPFLKVRLVCNDHAAGLSSLLRLEISTLSTNTAAGILGFGKGLFSQTRLVRVPELVKDFNQRTLAVVASSVSALDFTGTLRTDPFFPTKIVAYKFSGKASVAILGPTATVTVSAGGLLAAGVEVGDLLVLRSGPDPDEFAAVTTVTDTVITCSSVGLNVATNIDIEVGENFPMSFVGRTIHVDSGPNDGDYEVTFQGPVPFDFTVSQNLPLYKTGQATPVVMQGTIGLEFAAFSSLAPTVASRVLVKGSAAGLFYTGGTSPVAIGSSPWFKLPEVPLTLQAGDTIQTFATQYNVPTAVYVLSSVERSALVVGIEPEIVSNESWTFSSSIPVPFAQLMAGTVSDASVLSNALGGWLSLAVNQSAYFIELAGFLNPLLVNTNPTNVQVNDAVNKISSLSQALTLDEDSLVNILGGYKTDTVGAVDTLIQSFLEKGADRAVDILLSANFTGFFGLSSDTSSYAGTMLSSLRDVAREDLPINKFERAEAVKGKLISAAESDDFEFSSADIEAP